MLTIYKYELAIRDISEVIMPQSANVLSVDAQKGNLCLWAEVESAGLGLTPMEKRSFRVAGTGHPLEFGGFKRGRFIGTAQVGQFVWHVYEEKK